MAFLIDSASGPKARPMSVTARLPTETVTERPLSLMTGVEIGPGKLARFKPAKVPEFEFTYQARKPRMDDPTAPETPCTIRKSPVAVASPVECTAVEYHSVLATWST